MAVVARRCGNACTLCLHECLVGGILQHNITRCSSRMASARPLRALPLIFLSTVLLCDVWVVLCDVWMEWRAEHHT
jgi:hypothetical protein